MLNLEAYTLKPEYENEPEIRSMHVGVIRLQRDWLSF